MELEFPFGTGLPFQMFRCSHKFSAGTTQKAVFHLLSSLILRKLFVNNLYFVWWTGYVV